MTDLSASVQNAFPAKRIAVIGDLVADQFLNGTISRVSREAPVFIMRHENTITLPGAAANAAANVASLGGTPFLFGFVGSDQNGEQLTAALKASGVASEYTVSVPQSTTTTKVRVLAGQQYAARQQVIRIDYENQADIPDGCKEKLIEALLSTADHLDGIIVSDYGYGSVFPEIFEQAKAIARARGIPVVVDSRYRLESFTGATAATPNREEVENIAGKHFLADDCISLRERLRCKALLVTNGNQGMSVFSEDRPPLTLDAVGPREPVDVTGAGDTVIAAFTLGLASNMDFADAAAIANHAGGIVVMKSRTATVTAQELLASIASAIPMVSNQAN